MDQQKFARRLFFMQRHKLAITSASIGLIFIVVGLIAFFEYAKSSGISGSKTARELATPYFEKAMEHLRMVRYNPYSTLDIVQTSRLAHEELTKAINLDRNFADAFLARAELNFGLGRLDDAFEDISASIWNNPGLSYAYYLRVLYRFLSVVDAGNPFSVSEAFNELLVAKKNETPIKFDKNVIQRIENDARELQLRGTSETRLLCAAGILASVKGDIQTAKRKLSEAINKNLSDPDLYVVRGYLKILHRYYQDQVTRKKLTENALEDFEQAIKLRPSLLGLYSVSIHLNIYLSRYDMAMKANSALIEYLPDDPVPYLTESLLHYFSGNKEAAVISLGRTRNKENNITDPSKKPYFYILRANVHKTLGLPQECENDLNRAVECAPANLAQKIADTVEKIRRE